MPADRAVGVFRRPRLDDPAEQRGVGVWLRPGVHPPHRFDTTATTSSSAARSACLSDAGDGRHRVGMDERVRAVQGVERRHQSLECVTLGRSRPRPRREPHPVPEPAGEAEEVNRACRSPARSPCGPAPVQVGEICRDVVAAKQRGRKDTPAGENLVGQLTPQHQVVPQPQAPATTTPPAKPETGIPVTDQTVQKACGTCHRPDDKQQLTRISFRRTTPEGWERTITRMMALNGLKIDAPTARAVVKSLSNSHGLAPDEARPVNYEMERRLVDEKRPTRTSTAPATPATPRAASWRSAAPARTGSC